MPTYRKVRALEVYPGIDVVYYGRQGQLEYDFVLAPGASSDRIRMELSGADQVSIDRDGNLLLKTAVGTVTQRRPELYQVVDGQRRGVEGSFAILDTTPGAADELDSAPVRDGAVVVGFQVGSYDRRLPLTIDPVLSYASYLGGSGEDTAVESPGIAVDAEGYVYVTGLTTSSDFPIANAYQSGNRGGSFSGRDAFLTKLTPDGSELVYSTYFGGSGDEWRMNLALTSSGEPVLFGSTTSSDLPTTAGALKRTVTGTYDVFVAQFNASGSNLVFSTLLGGSAREWSSDVAVDGDGSAYVTGLTESADYHTTPGAFQTSSRSSSFDIFVTKLTPGGSLDYSTYLGGFDYDHPADIAVTSSGEAIVCGLTCSADFPLKSPIQDTFQGGVVVRSDGFITRLNSSGSALVASTYLGGSADESVSAVTWDASGNIYAAGNTSSPNFPTTAGAFSRVRSGWADGFLVKLGSGGTVLEYSTLVGGFGWDGIFNLAVDGQGNAWAVGRTDSPNFPMVSPTQPRLGGGEDGCVLHLNATGSALLFSSYLGGSGNDVVVDLTRGLDDDIWVVGSTESLDLPTVAAFQPAYGGGTLDLLVARFGPSAPEAPSGLAALAITSTSVELTWNDNSDRESGFRVERRGHSQAEFQLVGEAGAGVNHYTDGGVSPGETYIYRVQAWNGSGASAYSEELPVTTLAPPTFSISGRITEDGAGVAGVSVSAGGRSVLVDSAGTYTLAGLPAGTYEVIPEKRGLVFDPPQRTVTLGPNGSDVDFTASSGPFLQSIKLSADRVRSRGKVRGTLKLNRPATGNVRITLVSDTPSAAPAPRSVVRVRKGSRTGTFVIRARRVESPIAVTFTAAYGGASRQAVLTVKP
ncbi:MAG: SBBP repeat-containing protein [Armatimonadota bacterium]